MAERDAEKVTTSLEIRRDQLAKIDELKARRQRAKPDHRTVSRASVVRDALDKGLPSVEEDIEAEESQAADVIADGVAV